MRAHGTMLRMRRMAAALPLLLGGAMGTTGSNAQEAAKTFPPEQIARGSALYARNCESCHGVKMIGPPWAIDLATVPRDNPNRFVDSVTYCKNTMPPWGDVLKPDEIQALWAYLVAGEPKN